MLTQLGFSIFKSLLYAGIYLTNNIPHQTWHLQLPVCFLVSHLVPLNQDQLFQLSQEALPVKQHQYMYVKLDLKLQFKICNFERNCPTR